MSREKAKRTDSEREEVRRLLREAFPGPASGPDLKALTHDEAVHMRSRLALVRNKDLPFYLCHVLQDLLDTHTGRAGDSEDAEAVVQHLNVLVQGADFETIREHLSPGASDQALIEENYIRAQLGEAYRSFTPKQANAILRWLEFASSWEDLKWYRDEINAALLYWKHGRSAA